MGKDNSLVMFFYYSRNTMRSWFQYKVDAFVRSIAVFLREATAVIVIYLTLLSFHSINGWKAKDLLFLYSLVFLTYGVLIIFFTGLRDFGGIVQDGTLDRFILRPRGILFRSYRATRIGLPPSVTAAWASYCLFFPPTRWE